MDSDLKSPHPDRRSPTVLSEQTWGQWHAWMKHMAGHPIFQEVHRRSQGTFDKQFQNLVDEAVRLGAT